MIDWYSLCVRLFLSEEIGIRCLFVSPAAVSLVFRCYLTMYRSQLVCYL